MEKWQTRSRWRKWSSGGKRHEELSQDEHCLQSCPENQRCNTDNLVLGVCPSLFSSVLGRGNTTGGNSRHREFVLVTTQNWTEVVNNFLWGKHLLFLYTFVLKIAAVTVHSLFHWCLFSVNQSLFSETQSLCHCLSLVNRGGGKGRGLFGV